jgi:hypothetical protein
MANDHLTNIEQSQHALRRSIEATKDLAAKSQRLIDNNRQTLRPKFSSD